MRRELLLMGRGLLLGVIKMFQGLPWLRIVAFQCRELRFNPGPGNEDTTCCSAIKSELQLLSPRAPETWRTATKIDSTQPNSGFSILRMVSPSL